MIYINKKNKQSTKIQNRYIYLYKLFMYISYTNDL